MDAYNTNQLSNLQAQIQQIQQLMNQPRPTLTPPAAPQPVTTTIPFVDGLDGARQYLKTLGPNSSAAVFDKEEAVFYTLSVDANGNAAPIKIGRFVVEDAPEPGTDTITKADFEGFKAEIRAALAAMTRKENDE